jgi:hypothetical protein
MPDDPDVTTCSFCGNDLDMHDIKHTMIDALQEVDGEGVLRGDWICHEDIPEETPRGFDTHFSVIGEDIGEIYLVLIQKIKV